MALITYNEEHIASGDTMMSIDRAELYFIFQTVITQIEGVLQCLGNENWLGIEGYTRQ